MPNFNIRDTHEQPPEVFCKESETLVSESLFNKETSLLKRDYNTVVFLGLCESFKDTSFVVLLRTPASEY